MVSFFQVIKSLVNKNNTSSPEIITVKSFQKIIGFLGIFLAFFLMFGHLISTDCMEVQPSISHYYYTNMRDLFIGNLFVVAVFLYCYKGYNAWDNLLTNIASISAFIVALVPTYFDPHYKCQKDIIPLIVIPFQEYVHLAAAGVFLFALAILCITSFPQSDRHEKGISKNYRNTIYLICGWSIIIFVVLDGLALFFRLEQDFGFPFVFVCEAIAMICFGVSWLTKAKVFFPDKDINL